MIYLDNAATSMPKPACVTEAVVRAMSTFGNAGRGSGPSALGAARTLHDCRVALARLLGCSRPDHVCFAANSTAALNTAIYGLVRPGERVVTTVLEHNSVLRPLRRLAAERGAEVAYAGCDGWGRLRYDELEGLLAAGARAVVVTQASNVTGNSVDVARVAALAHAAGALVIVDASQSAGALPIDMQAMGLDVVCFTGHKGLLGPQGTGGLAVAEGVDVRPLVMGGSGVHSFEPLQPTEWPVRLEAGTVNGHGVAGLLAGVRFIGETGGPAVLGAREFELARQLYLGVRDLPGVRVYGDWELCVQDGGADAGSACPVAPGPAAGAVAPDGPAATPGGPAAASSFSPAPRAAIVALNIANMDSGEVSDALLQGWGIATRPGAHCAPLMHRALGTVDQGIVRFSVGWNTTPEDIATAVEAVRTLAC